MSTEATAAFAEEFLPELPALRLEQDPVQRHKDVLAHTITLRDPGASRETEMTA